MSLERIANKTIGKSSNVIQTIHLQGNVKDIVQVILEADEKSKGFTAPFAKHLKGKNDQETLKNIWQFIKDNIRYKRDEAGHEIIKSPGKTWQDKTGDCKSYSVFIGSLLQNLGYSYFYRTAFYNPTKPEQGHIYPIAVVHGTPYILDAVHSRFNEEVPFWKKKDYSGSALSGLPKSMNWQPILLGSFIFLLYQAYD